jgi:putative ABC transport system permease protein
MIAVVAWVFAVLCGSGLSWILLHVINVRSFGWLLPLHVPLGNWMLSLLWSLLAATLATWIPLRLGSSMSVSRALREA